MRLLPRLRLSLRLRTLMLLVVAFVLGMATDDIRHRHDACMKKAIFYEKEMERHRSNLSIIDGYLDSMQDSFQAGMRGDAWRERAKPEREKARKLADRCDELRAEFERAAWTPFAPMPDEPKTELPQYWIPHVRKFRPEVIKPARTGLIVPTHRSNDGLS